MIAPNRARIIQLALGILPGTTIASVLGPTITLSQNAVASNTGQALTVLIRMSGASRRSCG